MPNIDLEKTSNGLFERFLYWFLIPVLFTAFLTVILLSVFDYQVMNTVLKVANKIPVIEKWVPDPQPDIVYEVKEGTTVPTVEPAPEQTTAIADLENRLAAKEQELLELSNSVQDKDTLINKLLEDLEKLEQKNDQEATDEEAYQVSIQKLASVYAKMMPSKAAPVVEKLTLNERVLVLSQMKQTDQVKLLEKMNPQIAAETSILLKDTVAAKDRQVAALQDRLQQYLDNVDPRPEALTFAELGQTFAAMQAKSAAEILFSMRDNHESKVIGILRAMNVQSRSAVLSELTVLSKQVAASLTAKLNEGS